MSRFKIKCLIWLIYSYISKYFEISPSKVDYLEFEYVVETRGRLFNWHIWLLL